MWTILGWLCGWNISGVLSQVELSGADLEMDFDAESTY